MRYSEENQELSKNVACIAYYDTTFVLNNNAAEKDIPFDS
jgi:hypothetical protein